MKYCSCVFLSRCVLYLRFCSIKYLVATAKSLFHQSGSNKVSDVLFVGTQVNVEEKQDKIRELAPLLCLGWSATKHIARVIKGRNTALSKTKRRSLVNSGNTSKSYHFQMKNQGPTSWHRYLTFGCSKDNNLCSHAAKGSMYHITAITETHEHK